MTTWKQVFRECAVFEHPAGVMHRATCSRLVPRPGVDYEWIEDGTELLVDDPYFVCCEECLPRPELEAAVVETEFVSLFSSPY